MVSARKSESSTAYELEDGTSHGRISARQWVSDTNCDELPDDYSKLYVHVVGHLDRKVQLNSRNWVIIEHIHAVTDMPNRLFFHILETAFVTLSLQRGPPVCCIVSERTAPSRSHAILQPQAAAAPNSVEPPNATAPMPTPVRRDAPTTPRRVAGSSSQPQPAVTVPSRIRNPDPPASATPSSRQQRAPHTPARETVPATPTRQAAPTRQQPVAAISPSPSPPPSSPSPGPSSPPPPRTPTPPRRPSSKCVLHYSHRWKVIV